MSDEDQVIDLLEPIAGPSNTSVALSPVDVLQLPQDEISIDILRACLSTLTDQQVLPLCVSLVKDRGIESFNTLSFIVDTGVERGSQLAQQAEVDARARCVEGERRWDDAPKSEKEKAVRSTLEADNVLRQAVIDHSFLVESAQRLETYTSFSPASLTDASSKVHQDTAVSGQTEQSDDVDIDDPWGESTEDETMDVEDPWERSSVKTSDSKSSKAVPSPSTPVTDLDDLGVPIHRFLFQPLATSSLSLASSSASHALKIVYERHEAELWPYRYALLEAIPIWTSPLEFVFLLPRTDSDGVEVRPVPVETSFAQIILSTFQVQSSPVSADEDRKSSDEISQWYIDRINELDDFGIIDIQLAWVQHGASLGVSGLDALGEDLSLLSRLVYDSHLTPEQQAHWSLASWRSAPPDAIIRAYLATSNADGVVNDIRRLVLPYLYVLESRAERAGKDHKDLVDTFLHNIVLDLPLEQSLPVFEASKATTPQPERIIKNDIIVARLALACLYGSNTRDAWSTKSAIFECLPVWDVSGGDPESDKEATATTLDSIALFVRPTRADAHPPTAKDLFFFFSPLPFASLSRALDILDVHLESGEILARWDTPVQLRFLLQSARDKAEQKELAEKMVRRQTGSHQNTEQRWWSLWGDMGRLNGGGDALLRGAFGVLTVEEMMEIYLGGVLSSGNFDAARRIIKRLEAEVDEGVPSDMLERVAMATSREYYENAESGNIHTGEMKLAYDCLSVPEASESVVRERDFIEATSRLMTFSLPSSSGSGTLSPLEIRHSKAKLDLVERVLTTSDDAYRHPDLILDLADKLGYRKDTHARIRVLAMLSTAARRLGDYDVAEKHCGTMFNLSTKHRNAAPEVVWKECLALGGEVDYSDVPRKMALLGHAIELCPPEEMTKVLETWRRVENSQIKLADAAKRRRLTGAKVDKVKIVSVPTSTVASPIAAQEERVLGSRTAARAAKLAMGFAGDRFNLRGIHSPIMSSGSPVLGSRESDDGHSRHSGESERPVFGAMFDGAGIKPGTAEAERVRHQARKALVRGVGWLLGADEREIEGDVPRH